MTFKFSTLASVVASAPKPPLSLLRVGAMTTPMGAGLVVGSVVAVEAFKHKDAIESTLGKLASGAKETTSKVITTTEKVAGITPALPSSTSTDSSSMIIPLLAVGGLVAVFFIMKK